MRQRNVFLIQRVCFVAALLFVATESTIEARGQGTLSPAERWILKRVAAGEDANMEDFSDELQPSISASFLKKLRKRFWSPQ